MISVSLPLLIGFAVIVSALSMWLNARGVGVGIEAGVILGICVAVDVWQGPALASTASRRMAIRMWLVFVLLPTAVVLGISRFGLLTTKPWFLLVLGPISFMVALIVVATVDAVLFGSRSSR
jgi:hypothetical protein